MAGKTFLGDDNKRILHDKRIIRDHNNARTQEEADLVYSYMHYINSTGVCTYDEYIESSIPMSLYDNPKHLRRLNEFNDKYLPYSDDSHTEYCYVTNERDGSLAIMSGGNGQLLSAMFDKNYKDRTAIAEMGKFINYSDEELEVFRSLLKTRATEQSSYLARLQIARDTNAGEDVINDIRKEMMVGTDDFYAELDRLQGSKVMSKRKFNAISSWFMNIDNNNTASYSSFYHDFDKIIEGHRHADKNFAVNLNAKMTHEELLTNIMNNLSDTYNEYKSRENEDGEVIITDEINSDLSHEENSMYKAVKRYLNNMRALGSISDHIEIVNEYKYGDKESDSRDERLELMETGVDDSPVLSKALDAVEEKQRVADTDTESDIDSDLSEINDLGSGLDVANMWTSRSEKERLDIIKNMKLPSVEAVYFLYNGFNLQLKQLNEDGILPIDIEYDLNRCDLSDFSSDDIYMVDPQDILDTLKGVTHKASGYIEKLTDEKASQEDKEEAVKALSELHDQANSLVNYSLEYEASMAGVSSGIDTEAEAAETIKDEGISVAETYLNKNAEQAKASDGNISLKRNRVFDDTFGTDFGDDLSEDESENYKIFEAIGDKAKEIQEQQRQSEVIGSTDTEKGNEEDFDKKADGGSDRSSDKTGPQSETDRKTAETSSKDEQNNNKSDKSSDKASGFDDGADGEEVYIEEDGSEHRRKKSEDVLTPESIQKEAIQRYKNGYEKDPMALTEYNARKKINDINHPYMARVRHDIKDRREQMAKIKQGMPTDSLSNWFKSLVKQVVEIIKMDGILEYGGRSVMGQRLRDAYKLNKPDSQDASNELSDKNVEFSYRDSDIAAKMARKDKIIAETSLEKDYEAEESKKEEFELEDERDDEKDNEPRPELTAEEANEIYKKLRDMHGGRFDGYQFGPDKESEAEL